MKKIGVILHGSGVYDGTEIHEATLALLAIKELGADYQCYAPNMVQHHVINHLTGEEMSEQRNVLVESARIARGAVKDLKELNLEELDGLLIPGGFGAAKNLSNWAFNGPAAEVLPEVKELILKAVQNKVAIASLCVSPVVIAKALEGSEYHPLLTLGTTEEASPYDISGFAGGIESVGSQHALAGIDEVIVDEKLKIVTAPCYMMETDIVGIRKNTQRAVQKLLEII
ncbi:isoprenoid biosynthesis glyoxalase ElbB [Siphonobacter sp. SORGH_AS_1065]|uniref:isoprenoid biosynthesis glyoxalase ElbB n=1 Tax=Siphonobacter sp. SORGH_AS_1065 TaxID=3041795 RepID=UPI002785CBE2|nr:isoprenoid biosynthesis glyoxalase ElbB [Siphonobacter sp. SORGH_AS_1065]MDQ1088977.1 enhancing lycopene biosynthesis protein 2 [Siphonobacter sp. SORGH_AS_1065]